ncbi:sensor histidine kinase [Filimonas effusa]|uniref:GHKL domain-containing protein n=1 Tax=Filimonas effusa TaxID=2508721 RepID=A0A4Q1D9S8_9BACT|nr:histidine kinase [Filimonas effusa]RXK85980.1 GHKL domain-containing protein [Filimonas effusa]
MLSVKERIKDNYTILACWVMLFFALWLQVIPETTSLTEATLYPTLTLLTVSPITTYLSNTLLPKAIKHKTVVVFVFQFLGCSVLIGVVRFLYMYLFAFLENEGVFPLSEYFNMNIPTYYVFVLIPTGIAINLCICGVRFFQENLKLKKTLIEYQLRTLQHQITPHFMFNVLNHIHILMQSDVDLASDLLIKYSEILRYQLYNGDRQHVTLEQDIQFLKDFIAIEEIRWEGKLTVSSSWKIEDATKEIPALLFITFVENAFKHVSKSDFEKGYIHIGFEQAESRICFHVENSKSTLSIKKRNTGGVGLKNTKERLEILYPGKYELSVAETDRVYRTKLIIQL